MTQNLEITQTGQGQPIVFIHGWGLNSGIWQPLVDFYSQHFSVLTVDLPGFGINHKVMPEAYTLDAVSSLVHQSVLAHIQREAIDTDTSKKIVYIGWSLGGLVATNIVLNYKNDIAALVTIASSPKFVASQNWQGIQPLVLNAFHQQLGNDIQKTLDGFLKIQAMGSPHLKDDLKKIRSLIMAYPLPIKSALDSGLNLLEVVDLRDKLIEIDVPFLRLYGKLDSLVPNQVIEKIAKLNPNSESYVFEKASHAPFISHQSECCDFLQQWLLAHSS